MEAFTAAEVGKQAVVDRSCSPEPGSCSQEEGRCSFKQCGGSSKHCFRSQEEGRSKQW